MASIYILTDGKQIGMTLVQPTPATLKLTSGARKAHVELLTSYTVEGRFGTLVADWQKKPRPLYHFPHVTIEGLVEEIASLGWKVFGETLHARGEKPSFAPYDGSRCPAEGIVLDALSHPATIHMLDEFSVGIFIQTAWAMGCHGHRRLLTEGN